jgi:cytochrome b involved in lipid metabolism
MKWFILLSLFVLAACANSVNQVDLSTKLTAQDLSAHNAASDCWVSYQGTVYDLTGFLSRHPGGSETIAPYCGTSSEFEAAFGQKHGTTKAAMLKTVGTVKGTLG